nr:hypothetical protein [Helicobacter sp. NHP22-001]
MGQVLYTPSKARACQVLASGQVQDGSGVVLSIHKMSAKILNKLNHNGWDYFYVHQKGQLIPLNELRYSWAKSCDL